MSKENINDLFRTYQGNINQYLLSYQIWILQDTYTKMLSYMFFWIQNCQLGSGYRAPLQPTATTTGWMNITIALGNLENMRIAVHTKSD